jgi:hypothetical protein
MTRTDIQNIIGKSCGETASISSASKALGINRHTLAQWLVGVDFLDCGKKKLYLTNDIASAVIARRRVR